MPPQTRCAYSPFQGVGFFAPKAAHTHHDRPTHGKEHLMQNSSHHCTNQSQPITARTITRRIGQTNYKVNVHFSKTSRETMYDKTLRLIKNEANGKAAGL